MDGERCWRTGYLPEVKGAKPLWKLTFIKRFHKTADYFMFSANQACSSAKNKDGQFMAPKRIQGDSRKWWKNSRWLCHGVEMSQYNIQTQSYLSQLSPFLGGELRKSHWTGIHDAHSSGEKVDYCSRTAVLQLGDFCGEGDRDGGRGGGRKTPFKDGMDSYAG